MMDYETRITSISDRPEQFRQRRSEREEQQHPETQRSRVAPQTWSLLNLGERLIRADSARWVVLVQLLKNGFMGERCREDEKDQKQWQDYLSFHGTLALESCIPSQPRTDDSALTVSDKEFWNAFRIQALNEGGKALCRKHVPGWNHLTNNDLKIGDLPGGLSNLLATCSINSSNAADIPIQKVVVRIFGEAAGIFVDQAQEQRIFRWMSQCGLGVELYAEFEGGRVEQFLDGELLYYKGMKESKVSRQIATLMAKLHPKQISHILSSSKSSSHHDNVPAINERLPKWLSYIRKQEYDFSCFEHDLAVLEGEVSFLLSHIEEQKDSYLVGFIHGDIQEANIIQTPETGELKLFDFEYAGLNYRGFDIGNHFCECYIDHRFPSEPGYNIDESEFPSHEFMDQFIRQYLTVLNDGEEVSNQLVETKIEEARFFMMASHLQWAIWAMIQASEATIEGFNYAQYANDRMSEYFKLKSRLLLSSADANETSNVQ